MAEDWIKMRTHLYLDPKVCTMADILMDPDGLLSGYVSQNRQRDMCVTSNVTRNATVGGLVTVWGVMRHRGARYGDDLVVPNVAISVIDDISNLPGFGSAMEAVGWIEALPDTGAGIRFPRFFTFHNEDPGEHRREQTRIRQQRFRDKQRNAAVTQNSNARGEESRDHPTIGLKTKKKTKGEIVQSRSDGWMVGKTPKWVLAALGVNGNNLKVLADDSRITIEAIAAACDGLDNGDVRSKPAIIVHRLADRFGLTLAEGKMLDASMSRTIGEMERKQRDKP